jgi:hypothetical protein
MSSVTFSTSVGGDGSTVTDDNNATTGLRDGGWKTRFVPALTQEVEVAGFVVTKAGEALTSATNSSASAASALASLNAFKGQYYGALASNPTLDPLGAALSTGDLYFNTSVNEMRVYSGSAWVITYLPTGAYLPLSGGALTGSIGINSSAALDTSIFIGATLYSNSGNSKAFSCSSIIPSTTTNQSVNFFSFPRTQAASFNLTDSIHFYANQGIIGAGSVIANQSAFFVTDTLIGATNNYGLQSSIPAATGRFNLYINGTANNYFAGNVGIGTISPLTKLHVRSDADALTVLSQLQNRNAGTNAGGVIAFINSTNDIGDNRYAYIGAVSSAAGQNGNNLVFASNANGAAPIERMRIDTAGNVGIGATANASAILDAQSTSKGVRFPNMTTTQKNAIATPAAGLLIFDTTLAKLCVYSGAAWQTITSV